MKSREKTMLDELEARFVAYARIDTQSDPASKTSPSTTKQFDLLNKLVDELRAIGAQDVTLTAYGAVLATIPATVRHTVPTVAWLAHVDTAPQFTGNKVKPLVHRDYQGQPIVLPDDPTQVLSPEIFPYLGKKLGETIITTSGTTLLGADDKAGIAIIMEAAHHLLKNPTLPHGKIRVCFTPDEEIGRGVHADLPRDLAADVAYTLDGADRGEIVHETFSADQAKIAIEGVSVHPGWAKDKLVNATHLMAKIIDTLPHITLTPETTDGRQGFLHIVAAGGSAARCEITVILRDFETPALSVQAALLEKVCAAVQAVEPRAKITCTVEKQYRNMRDWLAKDMRPVELAHAACRRAGVEPFSVPIRGGTDGSRLTEMGVPTPNIFTGMQEIHGPLEWISLHDMAKATRVLVELAGLWAAAEARAAKQAAD
jgi:tripeptide aminopeptidase